jgi:hypothetical protein
MLQVLKQDLENQLLSTANFTPPPWGLRSQNTMDKKKLQDTFQYLQQTL